VSKRTAHGDFPALINLFSKLFKIEGGPSSSEALDMVVSGEVAKKRSCGMR